MPRSVQRYVYAPEQTYLIHKFIKFRDCLEAASKRTNAPLSSARTWAPFHHPQNYGGETCGTTSEMQRFCDENLWWVLVGVGG